MGEEEYELVMPFKTVQSEGGPHEDNAYAAGWMMGSLDQKLKLGEREMQLTVIQKENWPQLDLILMKHGYTFRILEKDPDLFTDWDEILLIPNPI